jgi:CubicO group peptidase (beta-lactamase class C family)
MAVFALSLVASMLPGCAVTPPDAGLPPPAAAVPDASFESAVQAWMRDAKVTGLAVAVIRGGQVVHRSHHGWADAASQRPLQAQDVLYGASLTKAVFALGVMQLVDEGRLSLDLTLGEGLPELTQDPAWADLAADRRWRQITLRQLLSHSSGLPNWRWIFPDRRLAILYPPGSRYVYSGEGFQLAQLLVEARTGQSIEALMGSRVFERFGMTDTSLTWRADFAGRAAAGHDREGVVRPHRQAPRARAAGSMDTTLEDMARFLAGVLRGEGLSASAAREMHSPQQRITSPRQFPSHFGGDSAVNAPIDLAAGLGWIVYQSPRGLAVFKEGNDEGTNNFMLGFPERGDGLVLMANSANGDQIFWSIAERLFGTTCLPWFWMGYVPAERAHLRAAAWRETPLGPGEDCLQALRRAASERPAAKPQ